jgi:hypothetical protein
MARLGLVLVLPKPLPSSFVTPQRRKGEKCVGGSRKESRTVKILLNIYIKEMGE